MPIAISEVEMLQTYDVKVKTGLLPLDLLKQREELLEALQSTQSLLERLGLESSDEYALNAAAIAKALGENH